MHNVKEYNTYNKEIHQILRKSWYVLQLEQGRVDIDKFLVIWIYNLTTEATLYGRTEKV